MSARVASSFASFVLAPNYHASTSDLERRRKMHGEEMREQLVGWVAWFGSQVSRGASGRRV